MACDVDGGIAPKWLARSQVCARKLNDIVVMLFNGISCVLHSVGRTNDDGAGHKAALLSGPPGIGKTTTAQIVCEVL